MSSLGYDYTLNSRGVAALIAAGDEARSLEMLFARLASSPFSRGDYQTRDSAGRTVEMLLHERWLPSDWADHAVKLMHTVDLEEVG